MSQPPSTQSVPEMRTPTGQFSGHGGADGVKHLQRKAHAVLQRAAVSVVALVRQGRQELVQQVAVRGVQLDQRNAEPVRTNSGVHKRLADALQARQVQRRRRWLVRGVRQGRGCAGHPAAFVHRNQLAAAPGHVAGALAPGVRELDADGHVRIAPHRLQHAAQRGLVLIAPQAQIAGRNAPLGLHRGGLQNQQRGT